MIHFACILPSLLCSKLLERYCRSDTVPYDRELCLFREENPVVAPLWRHASLYPHMNYPVMECKEVCGFRGNLSSGFKVIRQKGSSVSMCTNCFLKMCIYNYICITAVEKNCGRANRQAQYSGQKVLILLFMWLVVQRHALRAHHCLLYSCLAEETEWAAVLIFLYCQRCNRKRPFLYVQPESMLCCLLIFTFTFLERGHLHTK